MPNKYQDVIERFDKEFQFIAIGIDSSEDINSIKHFLLSELTLATTSAVQEYKDRLVKKVKKMESNRSGEEPFSEERQSKIDTWDFGFNYAIRKFSTLIKEE